jgi:hypothetical protein
MFTPRISPIHRNLATSYILVDALLDDLCLGGFSGIVEISLRDADYRIIIGRGQVSAIADTAGEDCGLSLIPDLASRGRKERGLVSIYRCSDESAWALTGRIKSKALYNHLSTEFADLEKMITKLRREPDREWFVEVETEAGLTALLYINQTGVHTMSSFAEAPEGEAALSKILEQCGEAGGTFSVYYHVPGEHAPPDESVQVRTPSPIVEMAESEVVKAVAPPAPIEIPATRQLSPELQAEYFAAAAESLSHVPVNATGSLQAGHLTDEMSPSSQAEMGPITGRPENFSQPAEQQAAASAGADHRSSGGIGMHQATDPGDTSTIVALHFDDGGPEAEAMPDVKRLMAEIASTIEKTAREIEPRDTFSIYLRAGQLKIADRYPFLDPFGSEFEYHAGEIAFIGREGPQVFVQGLTEALQLAVRSVVEASSQPERLRARIQENLEEITERLRPEFGRFGLEDSVNRIID